MIIRIVMLSALAAIGYLGFVRRNRLPFNIMLVFAILVVAALAVLFPERTDDVANWIGVGRGSDLIGYLVQVLLLFLSLHFYTKFVDVQRQLTEIVRELTILRSERELPPPSPSPGADPAVRESA
jgi:hypothetical protein